MHVMLLVCNLSYAGAQLEVMPHNESSRWAAMSHVPGTLQHDLSFTSCVRQPLLHVATTVAALQRVPSCCGLTDCADIRVCGNLLPAHTVISSIALVRVCGSMGRSQPTTLQLSCNVTTSAAPCAATTATCSLSSPARDCRSAP